jgi:hypothetical protein
MRGMRACATANAVLAGLAIGALGFAACSSGQAPSPPASPTSEATLTTVAPLYAPPPETPAARLKAAPQSVADCKQVLSDITNTPPDGGVVMNNAMTAGDAGRSDRFQPVAELIKSKNDAYRCCFDLWARKHPESAGKELPIKVQWNLKPDGALESAEVDKSASQLDEPEVSSCMVDISKGLTYPPSPSGKLTKFTYTFMFKVRQKAP